MDIIKKEKLKKVSFSKLRSGEIFCFNERDLEKKNFFLKVHDSIDFYVVNLRTGKLAEVANYYAKVIPVDGCLVTEY